MALLIALVCLFVYLATGVLVSANHYRQLKDRDLRHGYLGFVCEEGDIFFTVWIPMLWPLIALFWYPGKAIQKLYNRPTPFEVEKTRKQAEKDLAQIYKDFPELKVKDADGSQ